MKKTTYYLIITLSALLLLNGYQLNAQKSTSGYFDQMVEVTLKDGNVLIGRITDETKEEISLESATFGEIVISKKNIADIRKISETMTDSRFGYVNPNPGKYLIGQSGIQMEKGSVSYQNVWIFVNSFTYTPVEFFSITGGFEIISMFFGANGPYFYLLNPKLSFKVIDNLYVGGNMLYINSIKTTTSFSGLATLNAYATYGNTDYNFTVGAGWGWVENNFSERPIITFSGMARLSKGIGLVSENWLIPIVTQPYYGLYSYGIRFIGQNTSIDLAFINNKVLFENIIIGIPYLDFVVKF